MASHNKYTLLDMPILFSSGRRRWWWFTRFDHPTSTTTSYANIEMNLPSNNTNFTFWYVCHGMSVGVLLGIVQCVIRRQGYPTINWWYYKQIYYWILHIAINMWECGCVEGYVRSTGAIIWWLALLSPPHHATRREREDSTWQSTTMEIQQYNTYWILQLCAEYYLLIDGEKI